MNALHWRLTPTALALVAGSFLPLSMAPFHWPILAFASIALFFQSIHFAHTQEQRAHLMGLAYGIGVYALGIYWLFYAMHRYGQMNTWLTLLALVLFVSALSALFFWPLGALYAWISKQTRPWAYRLVAFPAAWVLFELLKTKLFTGFPWLLLGTSQLGLPFSGFAPILGVYGVGWLVVLSTTCLFECAQPHSPKAKTGLVTFVIILLLGCQALRSVHWTHFDRSISIPVRIVQPNIAIQDKWNQAMLPKILNTYTHQLQPIHAGITLLPEGMLPLIQAPLTQAWLRQIDRDAYQAHATIMVGGMLEGPGRSFYNTILLLGAHHGFYRKQHLVPFGEFMPFSDTLDALYRQVVIPMANLTAGPSNQRLPTIEGLNLVPSICYEIAYPFEIARKTLATQGNIIVSLSEDGWFGPSIEPSQHLQIAQMRALENGKPILVATNQGPSAIISPQGTITAQSAPRTQALLTGTMHPNLGFTPWTQWGHWLLPWLLGACLILPMLIAWITASPSRGR